MRALSLPSKLADPRRGNLMIPEQAWIRQPGRPD